MQALYVGDHERVRSLRAERLELDVFEAASLGDVERLRALLAEDPTVVGAWSVDGFTPLHYAAFFGGPGATRVLLEHGADLEAPARNEEFAPEARPLHSAAAAGRRDVCELLLAAGADPNARQHGGFTPLQEATQRQDEELAALLVRYGASGRGH
jgi:ankyrin repeat protein